MTSSKQLIKLKEKEIEDVAKGFSKRDGLGIIWTKKNTKWNALREELSGLKQMDKLWRDRIYKWFKKMPIDLRNKHKANYKLVDYEDVEELKSTQLEKGE